MKKILSFVLSLALILSLCACGGNEPEDATQAATEEVEAAEEKVDFTALGLGNDPVNFVNSAYSPAFDDEYIYYNDVLNDGIYRINHLGEDKTLIAEGANMYLNIQGDFLYYVYDAEYVMEVYKVDTKTLEEERVFMDDGYNNSAIKPFTMLVADNLIMYAYNDLDAHAAMAYNMETKEHITLLGDWDAVDFMSIIVDENRDVYIKRLFPDGTTDLHSVSLEAIKNYEKPNGGDMGDVAIAEAVGEGEDAFGKNYNNESVGIWTLDGSSVMLKSNANNAPGEIYFSKNMNLEDAEKICDTAYYKYASRQYVWNTYGAYKDKLYIVESAGLYDTDDGEKLTVVDRNGEFKRYNVK